ncbi:MAG TPA: nicotinate (nicotinamide) nucleotide adenylyltransferase [Candidatus Baltobacteraceae bacterium]
MKIGIFGGTFDPIHNVHLFVAESARLLEGLDRVLFVPTNNQHYRNGAQVEDAHRCAMILGAISDNPAFALDESDLTAGASGYTADLLPRLHVKYPDAAFTFIIGADSVVTNTWVRFDEVLDALERFVIAPRAGIGGDALARVLAVVPAALRARIDTLQLPELPESATLIRTLLAQGRSVRYLVPASVWQYIQTHKLYLQGHSP